MRWLIVVLLVFLMGCGAIVKYTSFDEVNYQPTVKVEIFSSTENIKVEYQEIGLITANDNGWDRSEDELIKEIRTKALAIGADAVILQNETQKEMGTIPIGGNYHKVTKRIIRAIAIKYK